MVWACRWALPCCASGVEEGILPLLLTGMLAHPPPGPGHQVTPDQRANPLPLADLPTAVPQSGQGAAEGGWQVLNGLQLSRLTSARLSTHLLICHLLFVQEQTVSAVHHKTVIKQMHRSCKQNPEELQ